MARWAFWVVLAFIASGCASAGMPASRSRPPAPRPAVATPSPGRPPAPRPDAFQETGVASWYGRQHHGKRTASGEPYDMNALTAAHRSLPLGTRVVVTNLDNGRSIEVRINDRGPYTDGRVIDLSYAAARRLGAVGAGVVRVGLKVVGDSEAPGEGSDDRRGDAAAPPVTTRD